MWYARADAGYRAFGSCTAARIGFVARRTGFFLEPWADRGAYLRCVLAEAHARRLDGRLDRKASRLVIRAARNSTCGYETRVRCCIMFPAKSTGTCKIMDVVRCDVDALHAEVADDLGSGSCFPNPCVEE